MKHFDDVGYLGSDLLQMQAFSIKKDASKAERDFLKVPRKRLVRNNHGCPRWIFIFRLVAYGKLYTRVKIVLWGMVDNLICFRCSEDQCEISASVWNKILQWQGIQRQAWICKVVACCSGKEHIVRI